MAQIIKQANIFGKIGERTGQHLAEQLPKEVERSRLAQGLQQLESEGQNLTPQQYYSRALQIPGLVDRPQVVQSLAELAKQQQIRSAYANRKNRLTNQQEGTPTKGLPQQNIDQQNSNQQIESGKLYGQIARSPQDQVIPSNLPREQEATSNPPAASQNPLEKQFIPSSPWSQEKNENAINEAFDNGFATNFNEAQAYANNQRELYENAPEKYRAQLDYKKGVDKEVDDLFDKQMEIRLQKAGPETFKDLTGDLQLNLKKQAKNSVATGKMTPEQAAEYYSKKGLDLVKDKNRALEIANRDIWDRILPSKKEESIKNLQHIAKNFSEMGSDEDFYNFLITDKVDENGKQIGMGLSPGGGALIQYARTPKVKNLINNTKISSKNPSESTRNFAQNLFKEMTPKDSFLAIARQMKEQDPNFDEYAYFDYLRENKNQYGSIPRLDREVNRGVSDFFPNWRDIGLFPAFKKSVAND